VPISAANASLQKLTFSIADKPETMLKILVAECPSGLILGFQKTKGEASRV